MILGYRQSGKLGSATVLLTALFSAGCGQANSPQATGLKESSSNAAPVLASTLKHGDKVASLALSKDGSILASGGSDSIKLWDVATRKEVATLAGHSKTVRSLDFSPDGKLLASASEDKTVKLWNVGEAKEKGTLKEGDSEQRVVAFLGSGSTLVSAGWNGEVVLWDVEKRSKKSSFRTRRLLEAMAISPDGKLMACGF